MAIVNSVDVLDLEKFVYDEFDFFEKEDNTHKTFQYFVEYFSSKNFDYDREYVYDISIRLSCYRLTIANNPYIQNLDELENIDIFNRVVKIIATAPLDDTSGGFDIKWFFDA